jgi:predicted DNA-binding protein with PD1-like motif
VHASVHAELGRIVFAQLEPDEDVYRSIVQLVQREQMQTGLIMTITGALHTTKLSMPREPEGTDVPPGVFEMKGTAEASGHGYFGMTKETWISPLSQIEHLAGEPFLHVHMAVGIGGQAYVGHLIEGCRVRSLHKSSHFLVVIAETKGVDLYFRNSGEVTDAYPQGLPYYELGSTGGSHGSA